MHQSRKTARTTVTLPDGSTAVRQHSPRVQYREVVAVQYRGGPLHGSWSVHRWISGSARSDTARRIAKELRYSGDYIDVWVIDIEKED
jgi:hypothetical protein